MCNKILFARGANGQGQLGLPSGVDVYHLAQVMLDGICPMFLSAGGNHTLMLDSTGCLFAAGDNTLGQCGNNVGKWEGFAQVAQGQCWTAIAAGWEFSVFATENAVWTSGHGKYGELGLGEGIFHAVMQRIPGFPSKNKKISQLCAGVYHVICLLDNGECWGWGDARHGELGPDLSGCVYMPTKMCVPSNVRAVACGRGFSVTLSMTLDVWGRLRGIPYSLKLSEMKIELNDILSLNASWSAVFILMKRGNVVMLGRDDLAQRCPAEMPPLKMLAVGSEHCLGIGVDGKVYGWGWNEHGNVREDKKDVREVYLLEIPKGNVRFVAAGCGTSWIYIETSNKAVNETENTIANIKHVF
ncbi:uncharacterized protein T551_02464 [Pneumocystis jirovecii RU7]|uniref:Uncharacterized protein n=1 Tax=Pneumocystis jirovecii (strain RU7) TaxID=1408657 RepID=A0A0W4ZJS7_PNEJ7|nr:uncharacterized protein T551_02464 [Pneumocystis jirovecii RU7]KTW28614.1 hypothetical protein T551_02464 [Pneumocystis jirovecii RU7]